MQLCNGLSKCECRFYTGLVHLGVMIIYSSAVKTIYAYTLYKLALLFLLKRTLETMSNTTTNNL